MLKSQLSLIAFMLITVSISAQNKVVLIDPANYNQLKKEHKLDPKVIYKSSVKTDENEAIFHPSKQEIAKSQFSVNSSTSCSCLVPLDGTFTKADFSLGVTPGIAPDYRCDDAFTPSKNLPFPFIFYGTTYTSCFININGNISFVNGNSSFSAGGFPAGNASNLDTIMIAPFWGDVDTRDLGSGLVYYKIAPTYMIVKWENVGYFSQHSDKKSTFQLIISNGTDPIIPNGNNIAFCYGDMQWTTGDASNGSGGFGGIPATVGVNKGDGISFIQMGRFDQAGSAYDGPYGNSDGVDWLDNQSFYFNASSSTNFPPIATTFGGCGDTIKICAFSDTAIVGEVFLAPENNQTLTLSASAPTLGGNLTVINNTSQNGSGSIGVQIIGSVGLAGFHNLTLTATDNGTPVQTTTINLVVEIVNIPTPAPALSISPVPACGVNPTITLTNCNQFDAVVWSTNAGGCSITVSTSDTFYVSVNKNGCYKTSFIPVVIFPKPTPTINGPLQYCNGTGVNLNCPQPSSGAAYQSFSWDSGISTNDTLLHALVGPHTVTVTDANGCTGSKSVTVTTIVPVANIVSPSPFCPGKSTVLVATGSSTTPVTYQWLPGGASGTTLMVNTAGTYSVIITDANGCKDTASVAVTAYPQPHAQFMYSPSTDLMPGTIIQFTDQSTVAAPATINSYLWDFGDTSNYASVLQNPQYFYTYGGQFPATLVVTSSNGCKDSVTMIIDIIYPITFPNIVTNNNDNINEFLEFKNLTYYSNNKLSVYDRWGKRLYESANYKNEWKPADLTDGTYYYILEVPERHIKQDGFFQLIK